MSTIYRTVISVENHISGNRSHGTIYPMFSSLPVFHEISDGENITETITKRVTIEDGTFEKVSNKIGYTGQHTDLIPQGKFKVQNISDGMIIESNSPYILVKGYSRNRFGGRTFEARLDCETSKLQRPIKRNEITKWYDFNPSQYID